MIRGAKRMHDLRENVEEAAGFVGRPIERVEDLRLLRGKGTFVDDVHRDGMLHLAVLRSPVAHGRIAGIGMAAARALPGVVAVFGPDDFAALPAIQLRLAPIAGVERFLQRPIAHEKVRYVGEPIAIVAAATQPIAEDALELIELDISPLAAVTDFDSASRGTALLFEQHGTNIAARYSVGFGDAEAAFASADYRRVEKFRCHRQTALPMETRGLVAEWDDTRAHLTVWGSTKVLWHNRKATAEALGLAPGQVDLVGLDVGGGFGVRGELYPEDFLVPFMARTLKRPVKWIEDRREHLMATNHSREIDCNLEIACARDGKILGLRGTIYGDMGAYTRTNGGVVPAKAAQFLLGPYRIPAVAFEVVIYQTNKTPVGTYRAPGRFEANFFRERLMDMAAVDLGIDAADFRRRNLICEHELPYSIGHLVPYEKPSSYDTGDYPAGFERILAHIGYERLRALNGKEIDGRRQGVGLACFVESTGGGPKENARFLLQADGTIAIYMGTSGLGQGHETVFAQVAADAFGIALDRIRIFNGSTEHLAEGFGTFASRGAIKGGSAVFEGAKVFIEALLKVAAEIIGRAVNDLHWRDGALVAHDGTVRFDLATLAREADARGRRIDVLGSFNNPDLTYTYGAHAAHVAVDVRTGAVEVLDYVAIEDVGRALNPLILHGQLIGAVVQGLGGTFLDHLIYDDQGQLLSGSLADYLVPTASDFPNVRGESFAEKASLSNPLGIKGGGEGGIVCVAAAVGNAVAAALRPLNVQVTELPLSPPRIWQAIAKARSIAGN
jgi:aerobic carbon-monoxide dehydrogenase large subunit